MAHTLDFPFENHDGVIRIAIPKTRFRFAISNSDQIDAVKISAFEEAQRRSCEVHADVKLTAHNAGHVEVMFGSPAGRKPSEFRTAIERLACDESVSANETLTTSQRTIIYKIAKDKNRRFRIRGLDITRVK